MTENLREFRGKPARTEGKFCASSGKNNPPATSLDSYAHDNEKSSSSFETQELSMIHGALSLAAQCIVIGLSVCLQRAGGGRCLCVSLLPR